MEQRGWRTNETLQIPSVSTRWRIGMLSVLTYHREDTLDADRSGDWGIRFSIRNGML